MGSINISKPLLSTALASSAVDLTSAKSRILQKKNSWECQETNPGPLGTKRERYPLCYAAYKLTSFFLNGFQDWRALMGPTKVFKTRYSDPETIRGQFGLTDTRNSTHGSDSDATARKEMAFFFPDFDPDHFFREISPKLLMKNTDVEFDEDKFVHKFWFV